MLQVVLVLVKRIFPQIMLPITITVGFIGYQLEGYLRSPRPELEADSKSVIEQRQERMLRDMDKK